MSTVSTILSRVRTRLNETTARQWSDSDQLIPYISEAERWLARMLSRIPKSHRFRVLHESITNPANTATFDLTGLTKKFDWLISLSVVVGNREILVHQSEDGDNPWLRNASIGGGDIVPRLNIQDDNLVLLPTYGASRTLYIDYGWVPAVKTSTSATIETPTEYDGDLVARVLHFALSDVGQANTKFEEEYAVRLAEIEDLERSRLGIRRERVVLEQRSFGRCR